jgi:hypothetical protein
MVLEKKPSKVTTRLAVSAPAGIGVVLLAGAVAFGSTTGLFAPASDAKVPEPVAETNERPAAKPRVSDLVGDLVVSPPGAWLEDEALALADKKRSEKDTTGKAPKKDAAKDEPKVEPADPAPKPEPAPLTYVEPKPVPTPAPVATTSLQLNASTAEHPGKVVLGWTPFGGAGFTYYKVVRTTDGDATWPAGGADEVIAALGHPSETWAKDRPACGTTVFYRVFAVNKSDARYSVLAGSNQASAAVACPPPPPATVGIVLQAQVVEGKVHLTWGACASEHFNAYKVVRSMTNPAPAYPETAGTELIAAIGDRAQTAFVDGAVATGQTWFYRVVARADNGYGTYIACQSEVVSVTLP